MILFVFEGKDDKTYFESIKQLFFPEKPDTFVCTYNSNIYSLYSKLMEHDALNGAFEVDTVSVLKEILLEKGDETLKDIREDEVSEIYLFFDYDFQENARTLEENNKRLSEMLKFFTDETANGKLYINYPMVESLRYTKELPDNDYWTYTVTRQQCQEVRFKHQVHEFSFYGGNLEYIILTIKPADDETKVQEKIDNAKTNWKHLVDIMSVRHISSVTTKMKSLMNPIVSWQSLPINSPNMSRRKNVKLLYLMHSPFSSSTTLGEK